MGFTAIRKAFTLVELLVVIGIIALLVSVLLPALSSARRSSMRAVCLSNMRQIGQSIIIYANQYKGYYPPQFERMDNGGNFLIRLSPPHDPFRNSVPTLFGWNESWIGLGHLFVTGIAKDPRYFYCPANEYEQYPRDWPEPPAVVQQKRIGYTYRLCGAAKPAYGITTQVVMDFRKWRLGYPNGVRSLTADLVGPYVTVASWPHVKPYGINAGFTDGHAEFVITTKEDYLTSFRLGAIDRTNQYQFLTMKALDTKDFSELRKAFP